MGSYDDLIVDGTFDYSHYGMTAEQLKIENYFVDQGDGKRDLIYFQPKTTVWGVNLTVVSDQAYS